MQHKLSCIEYSVFVIFEPIARNIVSSNSHMILKELDAFSSGLESVNSDTILEDLIVTAFNSPRILPWLDFRKNPSIVTGFMRDVTETKVGFKILYPVHYTFLPKYYS